MGIMSRKKLTMENTRIQMERAIMDKIGLNESIAAPIAAAVLDAFRDKFPGQVIYIPAHSLDKRNDHIKLEFTGDNHLDLIKKYKICRRQLNRILYCKNDEA